MTDQFISAAGGVVTFWSLSEYSRLADLQTGFASAGLADAAPIGTHPSAALKGALATVYHDARYLIRPLKRRGYCVAEETRGDGQNDWKQIASAAINEDGTLDISGTDWTTAHSIREAFDAHQQLVAAGQLSGILSRLAQGTFHGTALRPSGGIYWLAQERLPAWRAIGAAVEAAATKSSAVYLIQHDLTPEAIRAVQDAIFAEITGEADKLQAAINAGDLGERGLRGRENDARALAKKVAEYEQILGASLASLHEVCQAVETSAAEAIILAAADCNQIPLFYSDAA